MASKKRTTYPVIDSGRRGSLLGSQNEVNLITCAKTPNKSKQVQKCLKEITVAQIITSSMVQICTQITSNIF